MSGHSKWANIKVRKGAQDVKRGKIFTKLIREIMVAARMGGGDPSANPRLRAALLSARSQNMHKDTVEKAVRRGTGTFDGVDYQEVRYEGYGPGGVAVIVETLTDNINRTVAEVRHIFSRFNGNMGSPGCVAYMFDKKGQLLFSGGDEDALLEAALEAGAEDVIVADDTLEVVTAPEDFDAVREALSVAKFANPLSAEIIMRPQNHISLDEKNAATMLKLVDTLEDNDDVQKVYANFDISDEIMERLGEG